MPTKDECLKESGCFNTNHANVTAGIFGSSPFFDKKDAVQVKYEMVRAASGGEGSITEVAGAYGFSRKGYYQISKALEAGGICALIPKKKGPKGPSKLGPEAAEFIALFFSEHKGATAKQASAALEREKGIRVHPRTIYRHIKKN